MNRKHFLPLPAEAEDDEDGSDDDDHDDESEDIYWTWIRILSVCSYILRTYLVLHYEA